MKISSKTLTSVECILASLIFLTQILEPVFKTSNFFDQNLFLISVITFWVFYKSFLLPKSLYSLTILDTVIFVLLIYSIIHFVCFSKSVYSDSEFWLFLCYFVVFYLYRSIFLNNSNGFLLGYIIFPVIVGVGVVESCVTFLQFFKMLPANNNFNFTGTFSSPNFLGAYLSVSILIIIWYLFIHKTASKRLRYILILLGLFFLLSIVLTDSRTSWLSTCVGICVFLFYSKKVRNWFSHITRYQKITGGIMVFITIVFLGYYLYHRNPNSVQARKLIAKITLSEIIKKPWFGHGTYTFAGDYNKAKSKYFSSAERPWKEVKLASYASNPFNDYLYLAYEFGLFFLILFLLIIMFMFFKTIITRYSIIGIAMLGNILIQGLFTTPISIPVLTLFGVLASAIIIGYGKKPKPVFIMKRYKNVIRSIMLLGCFFSFFLVTQKATAKFRYNSILDGQSVNYTKEYLIRTFERMDPKGPYIFQLGDQLYQQGYKKECFQYMEMGWARSFAPGMGKRLARYYKENYNYKRAEEIYQDNIWNEPYKLQPRLEMISLLSKTNRLEDRVALSKEIIDLPVKVPSKRAELIKSNTQKFYNRVKKMKSPDSLKGSISLMKKFYSKLFKRDMKYNIYLPAIKHITRPLPVLYVTDGQTYPKFRRNKDSFIDRVDRLIESGSIGPIVLVFIHSNNGKKNYRQQYYLCNNKYVRFIEKELLPHIENEYPVSSLREDRGVLGYSFGGLFAAYLGSRSDDLFRNIIMQSPAFHPCPDIYETYKNSKKKDLNIYMSYGTGKDTEMQDIPMLKILVEKGYDIKINVIEDGNHTRKVWNAQLDDILLHFYRKTN